MKVPLLIFAAAAALAPTTLNLGVQAGAVPQQQQRIPGVDSDTTSAVENIFPGLDVLERRATCGLPDVGDRCTVEVPTQYSYASLWTSSGSDRPCDSVRARLYTGDRVTVLYRISRTQCSGRYYVYTEVEVTSGSAKGATGWVTEEYLDC